MRALCVLIPKEKHMDINYAGQDLRDPTNQLRKIKIRVDDP